MSAGWPRIPAREPRPCVFPDDGLFWELNDDGRRGVKRWPAQQIVVIDEDLGLSGAGIVERSGFARRTAEVALGHVGIVVALEVSRLARNNADWYRLLDLCGLTNTLIGDADGSMRNAHSHPQRLKNCRFRL
jgi:Resolvase, N terminal domain